MGRVGGRAATAGSERGRLGRRGWALALGAVACLLAIALWAVRSGGSGVVIPLLPAPSASPEPARAPRAVASVVGPRHAAGEAPPERRDSLLGAIHSEYRNALVLEVNALAHSPLGRLWLACQDRDGREMLAGARKAGIDPLVDVDRVAYAWDEKGERNIAVVSGHLARADPAALARAEPFHGERVVVRPVGGDASLVTFESGDFLVFPMAAGVWRDRKRW